MQTQEKHRILFLPAELERILNASNKIILTVADALSDQSQYCAVVGFSRLEYRKFLTEHGTEVISVCLYSDFLTSQRRLESYIAKHGASIGRKILFCFQHPVHGFRSTIASLAPALIRRLIAKRYARLAARFARTNEFDTVIVMGAIFEHCQAVLKAFKSFKGKFLFYQLDPWGLNELINQNTEDAIKNELEMFARADTILTTPVLLAQYRDDRRYSPFLDKMLPAQFPNIYPHPVVTQGDNPFDPAFVNIVYCGILDEHYRKCDHLLRALFEDPRGQERLRFYFWGAITSPGLEQLRLEYPDNLFLHQQIPVDQAERRMGQADVLLCIGNTLTNQVPSKLFDYFSFGKPILYLQKIANCPAVEYLERYPSQYTVQDSAMNVQDIFGFLLENPRVSFSFEKIAADFSDCTPSYLANQIMNSLSERCDQNIQL